MSSPRFTVRLDVALAEAVQARVDAGTPFATMVRLALRAYLALPADINADSLSAHHDALQALTARVDALEQPPRRQSADSHADSSADSPADTAPSSADIPATQVLGKLCPQGHEYQQTGQSLLQSSNHTCVVCHREQARARRARG